MAKTVKNLRKIKVFGGSGGPKENPKEGPGPPERPKMRPRWPQDGLKLS